MKMQPPATAIFITSLFLAIASADLLQNPDFEQPPSDLPKNSTLSRFLLNENTTTLPGWTFQGTVEYVTAGEHEHGILLGEDGKINQTFIAEGDLSQYVLTFALGLGGQEACSSNASLVVSAPDSDSMFSLKPQGYGREAWQVYGHRLGSWSGGENVNLVLQSQAVDTDPNSTCWPVVDWAVLKSVALVTQANDNLLGNGGFELGPAFLESSKQGILLDSEASPVESALQEWSITGTVRYIDSKTYSVPQGNAAIELVSGVGSGLQTVKTLKDGSDYGLEFTLGDANDSCKGEFKVGVQAGSSYHNYTYTSNGNGSANKRSITFRSGSSPTPIGFQSYTTRVNQDGVNCGPVIDGIALRASGAKQLTSLSIALILVSSLVQIHSMLR